MEKITRTELVARIENLKWAKSVLASCESENNYAENVLDDEQDRLQEYLDTTPEHELEITIWSRG